MFLDQSKQETGGIGRVPISLDFLPVQGFGQAQGFEYDMLVVYHDAAAPGSSIRRNTASFLPHFRNYDAVDLLLVDILGPEDTLGDALTLMESLIYLEKDIRRLRSLGKDKHPELDLRDSLPMCLEMLVDLCRRCLGKYVTGPSHTKGDSRTYAMT